MIDKPKVIHWLYSGKCNMTCNFCYGPINSGELTFSQKQYVVDKIGDSNIPKLTLTGGEPLIGKGIYDVIDHCKKREIFVSLHTNGILLDNKGLDRLDGKVGRVSLALDGSTNNMNYNMRGERGYLDIVIDLMRKLKERGIPLSVKTVASKKNIEDIPRMVEILVPYLPDVWLISEFVARRRGEANRKEYELKQGEFAQLEHKLQDLPFEVSLRSLNRVENKPFFFIESDGSVSTTSNDTDTNRIVGSILEEDIQNLWERITEINKVDDDYLQTIWTDKPS